MRLSVVGTRSTRTTCSGRKPTLRATSIRTGSPPYHPGLSRVYLRHATQSGAAATVLTDLFGLRPFTDTLHQDHDLEPRLEPRSFGSFEEAAEEAARSRLYAGIHYPFDNDNGLAQGRCIGQAILDRVRPRSRRENHGGGGGHGITDPPAAMGYPPHAAGAERHSQDSTSLICPSSLKVMTCDDLASIHTASRCAAIPSMPQILTAPRG